MRLKLVITCIVAAALAAGWVWRSDMTNIVTRAMAAAKTDGASSSGKKSGKRQRSEPTVLTAAATSGSLPIRKYTFGKVMAVHSTDLTSREQGVITKIAVPDGADVDAGQLLVKLDDRALLATRDKDKATLARDNATLQEAKADMARNAALQAKGAASDQTYDQSVAAAKVAEANVEADKATVRADEVSLADTEIRAPYSGRLGAFAYSLGALVTPGSMVVRLTKMAPVEVGFTLPQETLSMMRKAIAGGTATVRVSADGNDAPVDARVDFIDNQIDGTSGTYAARATVANADLSLWPGESVNVAAKIGERTDVVLVPTVAVQPASEGSIVFVVTPEKTIDIRKVEVAGSAGDQTAIASGLKAGQHVVVEGQIQLTKGVAVKEQVQGADGNKKQPLKTAEAEDGE